MPDLENLEFENIHVRLLEERDLTTIIRIDAKNTGYRREEYLASKLKECLKGSGIVISLVAEVDGLVVGFIMGDLFYGEFGRTEKTVRLSTVGVNPDFARQGVAGAMLRQFLMNLRALHVDNVETLVDWNQNFDLLGFFRKAGFTPGNRLHLNLALAEA